MLWRRSSGIRDRPHTTLSLGSVVSQLHETVRLSSQNSAVGRRARRRDAARHAVPRPRPHQTRLGRASGAHGRPRRCAVRRVHGQSRRGALDDRQPARLGLSRSSKPSPARTTKRRFAPCCATTQAVSTRASRHCSISTERSKSARPPTGVPCRRFPACRLARSRKARAIASSTSAASRIRPSRCRCAHPTCARGSCSGFLSTTRWRRN